MQMGIGSIVAIVVISLHGLEVNQMNNTIFQAELTYQVTMSYAQKLLSKQVITADAYRDFLQKMQEMYYPLLSQYMDETLDK